VALVYVRIQPGYPYSATAMSVNQWMKKKTEKEAVVKVRERV
jgi:hypothetical protein